MSDIITIELHKNTVGLLDRIVDDENKFFGFKPGSGLSWNRARFVDFLINDYHEKTKQM